MIRSTLPLVIAVLFLSCWPLRADDPVPASEDLFDTLDANADGTLEPGEIGDAQQKSFQRLLRVGDADENGELTRDEYLRALRPDAPVQIDQPGRGPLAQRDGQQRPDPGRLFEMADRDGDGKIALDDLPEPMQERLEPLFKRLGKDEITREDFENFRRASGGQPGQAPDIFRLFDMADRDGDGKVALDELSEPLQQRMQPLFERIGKDEITRADLEGLRGIPFARPDGSLPGQPFDRPLMALVRVLDADGNGQLSKSELEKLAEKFADLDRNGDGQLAPVELLGFGGGMMAGGDGRPGEGRRPEGDGDASRMQRPRRPDDSQPQPSPSRTQDRDPEQSFRQLDKDGDGFLNRDESPERIGERFDRVDANGDGKLSPDEFGRVFNRRRQRSNAN